MASGRTTGSDGTWEYDMRKRRYGIDDMAHDFATGFTWGVIVFLVLLGLGVALLVGLWLVYV
jgi:hypothetical protein